MSSDVGSVHWTSSDAASAADGWTQMPTAFRGNSRAGDPTGPRAACARDAILTLLGTGLAAGAQWATAFEPGAHAHRSHSEELVGGLRGRPHEGKLVVRHIVAGTRQLVGEAPNP